MAALPQIIEQKPPLIVPAGNKVNLSEQIIFVLTKDMTEEQLSLLREYGRVIVFEHKVYVNVPIVSLEFDYLIMDMRIKEDRDYFQQIDPNVIASMNIISFCHSFEKEDEIHDEIGSDNVITKLPEKQAFKSDFDRLLLLKKISKPRPVVSCVKGCFRIFK